MREIRANVRVLHEKKHLLLPPGVQRLLNSAAVAKFDTWRRDVAKGHIHSSFDLETRDIVRDLFESIIPLDFRGHEIKRYLLSSTRDFVYSWTLRDERIPVSGH